MSPSETPSRPDGRPTGSSSGSVTIERYQTGKLWRIPNSVDSQLRVVSFHCSTCPDSDNSRLLYVELRGSALPSGTGPTESRRKKVRMLLEVTRSEIEEVLASFGRHDNASTLRCIAALPGEPGATPTRNRSNPTDGDPDAVRNSLVP